MPEEKLSCLSVFPDVDVIKTHKQPPDCGADIPFYYGMIMSFYQGKICTHLKNGNLHFVFYCGIKPFLFIIGRMCFVYTSARYF